MQRFTAQEADAAIRAAGLTRLPPPTLPPPLPPA